MSGLYDDPKNRTLMCRCKPYGGVHAWEPGESCNPTRVDPAALSAKQKEVVQEALTELLSTPIDDECDHDWTLRPESDTWFCEMCGAER